MTKLFSLLLFSTITILTAARAHSAACCGGGASLPALILGDDASQVSTTMSQSQVDNDVFPDGTWQKRKSNDQTQTLKIDSAFIFQDRFQFGFSIPAQQRSREGFSDQMAQLGDLAVQVGYEYLPDWDYNPWRPKGVGFISLSSPTGKSIYDSDNADGMKTSGRGFWTLGLGTVLLKSFKNLDVSFNFEGHHSQTGPERSEIKPGWGGAWGADAGYSFGKYRLGAGLSWIYEDPIAATGIVNTAGSPQRFTTASLTAAAMLSDGYSASFSYADQSRFGSPTNTVLSSTVSLMLQKRWSR